MPTLSGEPIHNVTSNLGYALVAVLAFVLGFGLFGTEVDGLRLALALVGFGFTRLAVGSAAYHRTGLDSDRVRDHKGMFSAFGALAVLGFASSLRVSTDLNGPQMWLATASIAAMIYAAVRIRMQTESRDFDLARSNSVIGFLAALIAVSGFLYVPVWTAAAALVFGIAFYVRTRDVAAHTKPGQRDAYGSGHAGWHWLTSIGADIMVLAFIL